MDEDFVIFCFGPDDYGSHRLEVFHTDHDLGVNDFVAWFPETIYFIGTINQSI